MKIRRRAFLESAVAGAAGGFVVGNVARAAMDNPDPTAIVPTALVPLGKHLKVHRIGFGTGMKGWKQASNQTRLGKEHFEKLLHHAYDRGIRLLDMADLYGTHAYVARAFRGKPRESYTLVTKLWWRKDGLPHDERPDADVVVKRFLKELRTDYIDLVQLHCTASPNWPKENRAQMDRLEALKQKGLIRAHGCSCHSVGALEAAAAEPWVDVVHTRINPFGLKMDAKPEKVVPALRKIHAAGKGIVGMKIIGEGTLGDGILGNMEQKRAESVRFVVGLGCVDAMIVGFEQIAEMDEFITHVRRALTAQTNTAG
jgi:aryl-alcohol dehydrogenase-like predicted oxidoreductase